MFSQHAIARLALASWLVVILAGCDEPVPIEPPDNGGGGGGTLTITSTSPADGANNANFSAPVIATANRAIDAASVTVTSVMLTSDPNAEDVPRRLLLGGGGTSVEMSAALLPGTTYNATIAGSLQSTIGSTLGTPVSWSFTTRPFVSFALDSGRTGYAGQLGLARDGAGGLHAVYADGIRGDLFYTTCAQACVAAGGWQAPFELDPLGNVGSSSAIAVDGNQQVHIVYRDDSNPSLRYATCAAPCGSLASFRFATVDQSSVGTGVAPSIAIGPEGTIHVAYYDSVLALLQYSSCPALCDLSASWVPAVIDLSSPLGVNSTTITVDASGLRHVAYGDTAQGRLRYATCLVNCVSGGWLVGDISISDRGTHPALAVAGDGTVFATYFAELTGDLVYAECALNCSLTGSWVSTPISTVGLVGRGSSIHIDARSRRQIVFADDGGAALRYGTCANSCTTAARWRFSAVHTNAGIVRSPAAVTRPDNSLQVLFLAWGGTAVRFAE